MATETPQIFTDLDEANRAYTALFNATVRLKTRLAKALLEADVSWKTDHAVVDGVWYKLVADPCRADFVIELIRKKDVDFDATTLVIDRHE